MGWEQAGQTEIGGGVLGQGLEGMSCDWCEEAAVGSVERKRKRQGRLLPCGTRHYFCETHKALAHSVATNNGQGW